MHHNKATRTFKAMGAVAALAAITVAGMMSISARLQAQENRAASRLLRIPAPQPLEGGSEESLIQRGLAIAPVPLNLAGKNRALVGLGSYLVNAQSDCNSCHTAGGPPNFDFAAGGNPYFGEPKKVDPTTYMGGGQDFGPVGPPDNPGPDIVTRNLTPDKTGRPEGGHTLAEFKQIMRTGKDFDRLHPTCSDTLTTNCIGAPVDGSLLQIMPWPTFQNMTDHDLDAIYEYLSAIPCYAGPPAPSPLHNDCQ